MIQAQLSSNECEMRRVWAYLVSMGNTIIHNNQLSTLWLNKSVMTKIRMRGRRFCSCLKDVMGVANKKRRLRSSRRLPTDLSQSTQCYKTQSKLPSMIQAQLSSNQCEMRRENPVLCQCWIQLFTTINSQTMIEQKCDDQIRMRGRRFCYARDNR